MSQVNIQDNADFMAKFERCKPYTMVDPVRLFMLYLGVQHIIKSKVPGDLVECGVWRGGCCMLMTLTAQQLETPHRQLWMYDTYTGMTEPGPNDIKHNGEPAHDEWAKNQADDHNKWCYAQLDEVRRNMATTGYAPSLFRFVQGKVEDTIPAHLPERISLLRLDTDWYDSTYHELTHMYPLLSPNGVIIFDDFYFWKGQGQAAQRYFQEQNIHLNLMHTTTGAMAIKTPDALSLIERQAMPAAV